MKPIEIKIEDVEKQNGKVRSDIPNGKPKITHLKFRLLKTCAFFLCWFSIGIVNDMLGPALPSLKVLTDSNLENIGLALLSRSCGFIPGALIGGVVSDRFRKHRNVLLFIILILFGITTLTVSFCRSIQTLSTNFFFGGMLQAMIDTVGSPSLALLWKHSATGPFNFVHSGYGIGAGVAPLLIMAFDAQCATDSQCNSTTNMTSPVESVERALQKIQYPFIISGVYAIGIAFIFLVYSFIANPTDQKEAPLIRQKRILNSSEEKSVVPLLKSKRFSKIFMTLKDFFTMKNIRIIFLIIICFSYYALVVGMESVFNKYVFSFLTEGGFKFNVRSGYLFSSIYWFVFSIARIVISLISLKVQPRILIGVVLALCVSCAIVFTVFSSNELIFLIFANGFGIFVSPLFPTFLGFVNMYMPVNGLFIMVILFGVSAGSMLFLYLAGYILLFYGYAMFPIIILSMVVMIIITYIFMIILTLKLPLHQYV